MHPTPGCKLRGTIASERRPLFHSVGCLEIVTPEESRVIFTFLNHTAVDLRARGIDEEQARELRGRLAPFAEDWESPEMDAYDDYDAARSRR
jgi:hypothetical protein